MNIDSENDQTMRTPPSNSPPSSGDERSPPTTPQMRSRPLMTEVTPGIMMQVSEIMAENEVESNEITGKKKREEREIMLATQAEKEKLLDKDWREEWLKRWQDDFDERDMKLSSFSTSTTPTTTTETSKGKEPENAA